VQPGHLPAPGGPRRLGASRRRTPHGPGAQGRHPSRTHVPQPRLPHRPAGAAVATLAGRGAVRVVLPPPAPRRPGLAAVASTQPTGSAGGLRATAPGAPPKACHGRL